MLSTRFAILLQELKSSQKVKGDIMKQSIIDKLDETIKAYRSQIPDRYDLEIIEPTKENSEIAIVFSLKNEKELLRYESSEINLTKIEIWLSEIVSKIKMIDEIVDRYEPFIIVDASSETLILIEIVTDTAKHVIRFDLDLEYQMVNLYASAYFYQTTSNMKTVSLDVDSNSSLYIEGSDFFMHLDASTSCSIKNIADSVSDLVKNAEDFILSIES